MLQLSDLLAQRQKPVHKSQRNELLEELYIQYFLENKEDNQKRVVAWSKLENIQVTKESIELWKKKRKIAPELKYIKPLTRKQFAIMLARKKVNTQELFDFIGNKKELIHQGKKFSPWFFWKLKQKGFSFSKG